MQVPLLDLKAQLATIRQEVMPAIEAVIDSQMVCNGPAVRDLEQKLAEYCGCAAAVGVSSGTDALLMSLMALEIGPGDEVITTPFTFFATAGSVWRAGAKPVFVDIQADTFNIDPERIAPAVTEQTKAVIPVHLFGQTADMDEVLSVAADRGLGVIEDAAQAVGATYKGRKAGSMGTVGCLSFYPTKNLGGFGDGGMVLTQDPKLAERLAVYRNHGQGATYMHTHVGGNFRMDSIVAASLTVKLAHLEAWSARRRANAARYDELLADVDEVVTPTVREHNVSILNQYVIRTASRDALRAHLSERGVATGIYYPLSLHEQECFARLGYRRGDFPVSEQAARECLALPICPELTDEQLAYVVDNIKSFLAAG